jgi:hypothetical protein
MTGPSLRMILRRPLSAVLIAGEVAFSVVLIVHLVIIQRTLRAGMLTDTRLHPETLFVVDADGDEVETRLGALGATVARVDRAPHELTQLSMSVRGDRVARAWFVSGSAALPQVLELGSDGDVLITESLARELYDGPAVGRLLEAPPRAPLRVSAVVRDVLLASAWSLGAKNGVVVRAQPEGRRAPYLVRAGGDFVPRARQALSTSRFVHIESMTERLARNHANVRGVLLITVGVVLLLVVAGTTGAATLVSMFIAARAQEIGLRRALGARKGQVVAQLVMEALLISSAGGVAGIGLAFAVAVLTGTPFSALEPGLLGAAVVAVLLLTAIAAWIPARRAARIPPALAGKIS